MPIIKKKVKQPNPARTLTLSLLAVILVGTLLLCLPCSSKSGEWTNFVDSFFTATSATSTTGITVVETFTHWNFFGQMVLLFMMQIGGLGLVIILTFFNYALGRKMGLMKASAIAGELSVTGFVGAKRLFVRIGKYTLVMELVGAAIMCFTLIPQYGAYGAYMSIFVSVSAFCNAGMDLFGIGVGLSGYSSVPQVHIVIAALIFLGSIGFVIWDNLANYFKTKRILMHTKLVLIYSGVLFAVGWIAYFGIMLIQTDRFSDMSIPDKLLCSAFTSVSARSAGFNISDIALASDFSKLVTIALMFIGSAPASTGGGIRVTTLAILMATLSAVLKGQEDPKLFGHRVDKRLVYKAVSVLVISVGFIILCFAAIYLLNPDIAETDILYEVVSAFTTTGFSTGISANLDSISKLVLCLAMLAGRVGPVSLLLSFTSDKGNSGKDKIMPDCDLLIG